MTAMLQILGYLLLIGIAILLIKFSFYLLLRCCVGGILAFIFVGAITGALAIFGVISADTAWTISKWAFYIGTALNTIWAILHPIETISDAWDIATTPSTNSSESSSSSSSSRDDYDTIVAENGGMVHGDCIDNDTFVGGGHRYKRTYRGFCEVWEEEY